MMISIDDENLRALNEHSLNTMAINEAGLKYEWSGCHQICMKIKEPGLPVIELYPHTGKFKLQIEKNFRDGGAYAVLAFLKRVRKVVSERKTKPGVARLS